MLFHFLSLSRRIVAYLILGAMVFGFSFVVLGVVMPERFPKSGQTVSLSFLLAIEALVLHGVVSRWRRTVLWRHLSRVGHHDRKANADDIIGLAMNDFDEVTRELFYGRYSTEATATVLPHGDDILIESLRTLQRAVYEVTADGDARSRALALLSQIPNDIFAFYLNMPPSLFSEERRTERSL